MATGQITLLDYASKEPCSAWLRHSWKTRLVLNYKGLDYKTEWMEYPDVQPKLEPHLPPNPSGVPYTLPAAVLPDGTWIMDSANIARALEAAHPDPPLRLDAGQLPEVERLVAAAGAALGPAVYARVPVTILNEASLAYWYETRRRRLGVTVQELEETKGGEAAYAAAEPHLRGLTALLLKGKEADSGEDGGQGGPFFMGREVSYADFVWVALLAFLERVDGRVFAEVLRRTGDEVVHRALLEACGAWLERRSY